MPENDNFSPWRVNCYVAYLDKPTQDFYQDRVLATLRNVGWLQNIDFAISYNYASFDEKNNTVDTDLKEIVSVLVYFRSTSRTIISEKAFCQMIQTMFAGLSIFGERPVEVGFQQRRYLSKYPFPEDSVFCS